MGDLLAADADNIQINIEDNTGGLGGVGGAISSAIGGRRNDNGLNNAYNDNGLNNAFNDNSYNTNNYDGGYISDVIGNGVRGRAGISAVVGGRTSGILGDIGGVVDGQAMVGGDMGSIILDKGIVGAPGILPVQMPEPLLVHQPGTLPAISLAKDVVPY